MEAPQGSLLEEATPLSSLIDEFGEFGNFESPMHPSSATRTHMHPGGKCACGSVEIYGGPKFLVKTEAVKLKIGNL